MTDLRHAYEDVTVGSRLAGSGRLFGLTRRAKTLTQDLTGPPKVAAFLLMMLFDRMAREQAGAAKRADEDVRLYKELDSPITVLLDIIDGETGDLMAAMQKITDALFPRAVPH